MLAPHLQDVDDLSDVVAAALHESLGLLRIKLDALLGGNFHGERLNLLDCWTLKLQVIAVIHE